MALLLGLAQQLTGTEAVLYYSPIILSHLTVQGQFTANLGVGFAKFIGEIFAALVVEGIGRKLPLIIGNILLAACM